MLTQRTVSLADARRIITAGEARAADLGSPSNIAVVDAGGNLVAHIRMDGAQLGSIDHSINKAFTSVFYKSSTGDLAADTQPGGQFYGMALSNQDRVIVFAGGIPLNDTTGEIVGAVGVSGGSGHEDSSVAEAAVAAL